MALWTLPNTFATLTGNQPASLLDTNFQTLAVSPVYCSTVSGTNNIALTAPVTFASYQPGMTFLFIATATNTSTTMTINVNNIGVKSLYKANNVGIELGDIQQNAPVQVYYDGTNFMLMNPIVTPYAWRNYVVNGNMAIDQRNETSFTASTAVSLINAPQYSCDRWFAQTSAASSGTVEAIRINTTSLTTGGTYFALRLRRTSGTYAGSFYAGQVIDTNNGYKLRAQYVTLSFWARVGSAYGASTLAASVISGTTTTPTATTLVAGTWTGQATVATTTVTPSTSWQKFTVSGLVSSTAFSMGVLFQTGAFTGTGTGNDWVDIVLVQLEVGPIASPFEQRHYETELAMCQMFFQKSYNRGVALGSVTTVGAVYSRYSAATGAHLGMRTPLKVSMLTTPVIDWYPTAGIGPLASGNITDQTTPGTPAVTSTTGTGTESTGYPNTAANTAGDIMAGHYTADAEYQ